MRTAPAPNIPPMPGMCPCEFLMAGGGGGAGSGDSGDAAGDDQEGAGTGKDGKDAEGDQKSAPDYEKYPTCGTESHPVDVVTGRVFTHPIADLELPGPLPFSFERSYSSGACKEDQGLGYGWAHSLGWFIEVRRRRIIVWNHRGVSVDFPIPQIGHSVLGDWGWVLRRDNWGYAVDANDDVWRVFSATFDEGKTFRLTAIDDRNKNRIGITYDDGKLVEVVDSGGRVIKFTSTRRGQIASIQVKNAEHQGRWIAFARYQYDEHGRLVRVIDADDYSWTYAYDEFNRLICDTDRAGLSFCFKYDEKDRGIEAWGEYLGKRDPSLADDLPKFLFDGRTRAKGIYHRKFEYHPNGYTEVTDTTETRRYFGNKSGTLDKAVTGGAVTTSEYDERGFEIAKTDAMGATWRWVRDERGRALETVDPLGRRSSIRRDSAGLPVQLVDPSGAVTTGWRDQRGNLETVRDAMDQVAQFSYEERGLVVTIVEPHGAASRYAYDAQGNLTQIVQPGGAVWTMSYDGLGRLVAEKDASGADCRYVYTNRGDLVATYDEMGQVTRYQYDGEGHLVGLTSPRGYTTTFSWGGYGVLAERRDPLGNSVRLTYSREGELLSVINERGEENRLTYDRAGELTGERTFDGRRLRFRNDACGRPVRIENGLGQITEIGYDAAGQVIERRLPDGTKETFEWDVCARLVRAQNATGNFGFERNALGQIVRESQTVADVVHWVDATYDAAGNRVGRRTSLGHEESIQRDVAGARVATRLDGDHRIEHVCDALSREVRRTLPRGGVIESAYDAAGRTSLRAARTAMPRRPLEDGQPDWLGIRDDGVTVACALEYDPDGHVARKIDRPRGITVYDYDALGQLLQATPERGRAEAFRYDPAGNVYEASTGDPGRVYATGGRVLERGLVEYVWDDDGRLIEKRDRSSAGSRVWRYQWNGAGLLDRVDTPDGERVEFSYDPFGRRVEKRVLARRGMEWLAASSTRFVWDGHLMAHEIKSRGLLAGDPVVEERTYCYEDDGFEPTAQREASGEWVHHVSDGVGTPIYLVDDTGAPTATCIRSVWGVREDGGTGPLGFPGQYHDDEIGLAYNRARYYDPELARYISADPVGIIGMLNAFRYVPDPLTEIDPFGLKLRPDGVFELKDNYPPGSPQSRQLRRFAKAWNDEIDDNGSQMMGRKKCSAAGEKKSKAWKAKMRREESGRFSGKVVGHIPDAIAGGKYAKGSAMALDSSVNSSIGAQAKTIGRRPYTRVVVVRD